MGVVDDNLFPKVILDMQSSSPAAPSDRSWKVFAKANGIFARSSNTTIGPFGAGTTVATDAIWTTAGKVAVATGVGTAAEKYPPGYELDYAQFTSTVTCTNTSEGAADTVVTGTSQAYTADPVIATFFSPFVQSNYTTFAMIILYDVATSTVIGRMGRVDQAAPKGLPVTLQYRFTPSAATHQYRVKAYIDAGTKVDIFGGSGGSAAYLPGFLRITKV